MNHPVGTRWVSSLFLSALLGSAAWAQPMSPAATTSMPADAARVATPLGRMHAPGPMPTHLQAHAQGPRAGGPGPGGAPGQPAHPHGHGRHAQGGGMAMMLLGPGLDRALDLVKATPPQRADIRRIAGAARDDLRALRQDARPRREAWMAAWTADRIDAAALESERARMAAQRDAAGKRMIQAMVDIGAVLQPEQRRILAEHWARRGAAHRRAEAGNLDEHAAAVVD